MGDKRKTSYETWIATSCTKTPPIFPLNYSNERKPTPKFCWHSLIQPWRNKAASAFLLIPIAFESFDLFLAFRSPPVSATITVARNQQRFYLFIYLGWGQGTQLNIGKLDINSETTFCFLFLFFFLFFFFFFFVCFWGSESIFSSKDSCQVQSFQRVDRGSERKQCWRTLCQRCRNLRQKYLRVPERVYMLNKSSWTWSST